MAILVCSGAPRKETSMGTPNTPDVVKYFRYLLFAILALIGLNFASFWVQSQQSLLLLLVVGFVSLCVLVTVAVFVVMTTKALGWELVWTVVCAITMFVPCINLIVLIIINAACVRHLKAAGYQVGLMGAKQ
jgi:hypothetical protein